MPGPPPNAQTRRRNAPTIAGAVLPASGRTGPIPEVPDAYELHAAGRAWWEWAWRLPQSTMWDDGCLYVAARRAQLEDLLAALSFVDNVDLADLLAGAEPEAMARVAWALETLKRSASGATGVMKEQDALDDRLGLNPKAMLALRWTIDEAPAAAPAGESPGVSVMDDYRARLTN